MKKLDEHQLNLLAIMAFVVSLGGWVLTELEIIASRSPLSWIIVSMGSVLVVTYLVCWVMSRRSS